MCEFGRSMVQDSYSTDDVISDKSRRVWLVAEQVEQCNNIFGGHNYGLWSKEPHLRIASVRVCVCACLYIYVCMRALGVNHAHWAKNKNPRLTFSNLPNGLTFEKRSSEGRSWSFFSVVAFCTIVVLSFVWLHGRIESKTALDGPHQHPGLERDDWRKSNP